MPDNEKLSNEELDILFGQVKEEDLTLKERKIVGDTFSESMKAAASALTTILNKKVEIFSPSVTVIDPKSIKKDIPKTAIVFELEYTQGLTGPACILMFKPQSAAMADILMGGDGTNPPEELNDLYLNALNEAVSGMINSANTALSATLGKIIEISPVKVKQVDFAKEDVDLEIFQEPKVVKISYKMEVEDLADGVLIQLFPIELAKPVIEAVSAKLKPEPTSPTIEPAIEEEEERIHPVQFAPLKEAPPQEIPSNIKLILDIPMEVSVELGRTKIKVKDILNLGVGSVVELNKLANEPVDILVNGRIIAKGTVVVVDDSFGVRISDILTPTERLENLP